MSWASLKVQIGHKSVDVEIVWDCDVENTPLKLQHDTGNLWRVITFTMCWTPTTHLHHFQVWLIRNLLSQAQTVKSRKYASLISESLSNLWRVIQKSRSNLVEILMSRTSLLIKSRLDTGKFWCIIIFTRSCKMLPFEHDVVQKVHGTCNSWRVIMFTRSFDLGLDWQFKKVIQRSTSNLAIILNLVPCKVVNDAGKFTMSYHIQKELSLATIWRWPSLKGQKGQTKVNIELLRDFDVDNNPVKLGHDTGNSCWVIAFTR